MSGVTNQPLMIRADASTQIGTGHLMRCLALGQAWQKAGGTVTFVTFCESNLLRQRLHDEGFAVHLLEGLYPSLCDWEITRAILGQHHDAWLVLDGYHFDATYQQDVKEAGYRLLFVDDYGHADHYYADLVLNQNIYTHETLYVNREPYTRLLLGTRYALLRREFWSWRGWQREIPPIARKVLVTLGGSDPENVTLKVIQALRRAAVDGLKVVVVVGGSNPYYEELQSAIRNSPFAIRLEYNVTNMPALMAWADVAVSAGGSTCWELAFMGLPNLVLILTDNQRPIAERLSTAGVAVNLGGYENLSLAEIAQALTQLLTAAEMRVKMSWHGRQLVDGEGVNRVLRYVRSETVSLRQMHEDDCRLLWEWANDPEVRAVSFSSEPISWQQHVKWFKSKLNDPNCIFYVAVDSEGTPIGQVRYDIDENQAVISISIDRRFRGKGYGSVIIQLSSKKLFDVSDVSVIHAYIKQDNKASYGAFVKAGYEDIGATTIRGYQAIHLILRKLS